MSDIFEFENPTRIVVGTVGEPGQREFYLQAREGEVVVTLKIEKQQVAALASHLGELLQDLARPGHVNDEGEIALEVFIEASFVVGGLGVAYDATNDRVVIMAHQREREGETEKGSEARFSLTREQAVELALLGARLVESGRPACPLCGFPLDPRGHACPRTNGNSAPLT
jgi:uncharacterized repeat protein (TIGR03847 family)